MFKLTPPSCVIKIGTFGAVDPQGDEGSLKFIFRLSRGVQRFSETHVVVD